MSSIFTALFAVGALAGVLWWQNARWRRLARTYPPDRPRTPRIEKSLVTIILWGGGFAFMKYVGVTVGVCEDGLTLRLMFPLSIGSSPVFLPFSEMTIARTSWFLNSGSFAIKTARGGFEAIIDDEVLGWLQKQTNKCELAV